MNFQNSHSKHRIGITIEKNDDFCHTYNQIVQSSNIHSERE